MHKYFIKTPWLVKRIFPSYTWSIDTDEKILYFTFDDGPHPVVTPWVIDELKKYDAKATFFCIGKNVEQHPDIYQRILAEGHTTGNHTHDHLNGWKTKTPDYLSNIEKARPFINSNLFRPPYGKIRSAHTGGIQNILGKEAKIVMWDVLSADFDKSISPEQCAANVIENAGEGSVVVFHDSEKAYPNLVYALPSVLQFFSEKGYRFNSLS